MIPVDERLVLEIVRNVLSGTRTKAELRRCGCPACLQALARLTSVGVAS